ncbi:uracil-DNA glycosylase [bacterium]|nr:uracil-DNA glycosylase [bacterium]
MTPQKRQHHPVKPEVNSKTESESRRGKLLKNRDPNCPEPDPSWKNFAPEPKSVNPIPGEFEDPYPQYKTLAQFNQAICNCMKCPLGEKRNKIVFGVGDPDADLLLVGEAPGADEDRHGEPFVGRAGQLLDKILAAIDLERGKDVYIANILKCRPPDNRDPVASEVAQCESHLLKQIQLIKPKLILALGRIAGQTILNSSQSLTNLRGQFHDYHGVPLMVTFHPAALLRNPNWKKPTWEDVQLMKAKLMELKAEEKDA